MRVILFFLFFNLPYAHSLRIRYICPDKQKAYEEYCRTHKGYKIPPDRKTPPTAQSTPLNGVRESERYKTPQKTKNKSLDSNKEGESTRELSNSGIYNKNHKVSTSSSSSPSSISVNARSQKFIISGWFWNVELGWIYISKETYPYFYSFNDKKWLSLIVIE